jgi:hypothetical protein
MIYSAQSLLVGVKWREIIPEGRLLAQRGQTQSDSGNLEIEEPNTAERNLRRMNNLKLALEAPPKG